MERPTWEEFFFNITEIVSQRSTCLRRKVGALAVKNNNIIASGYNGAPPNFPHCTTIGTCLREDLKVPSGERHEICRAIHAEENLIIQASINGGGLKGCDIYVTHQPCVICIKKLIRLEPKNLYYKNPYPDKLSEEFMRGYFWGLVDDENDYYHWKREVGL